MMLLLMTSFTIAHAIELPPVPDLIAVAEHIPDIFHRNFSAFTFQDLMTAVEQLPGAVAAIRMPFAESPEWLPTVHQIGAMDAEDSSERLRYFASLFLLTYLATVLLGTCIMVLGPRCGCCGANGSGGGWQAMVTMVACDEDGTSLEDDSKDDSKSSEDPPAAEADTRPAWKIREDEIRHDNYTKWVIRQDEIESREVQRRWLVTMVFSAVFCGSLAAAVFSLTTDRLSKRFGLDWELYYVLFFLNCLWLEVQAIVAATRAAQMDRTFAATAFFEGTISATWPVIADTYDTLKDVLVGALCLHSSSVVLKVLGITSWLYLAAIHFVFLGWFPQVKKMVDVDEYGDATMNLTWRIEEVVGVPFLSTVMADRFQTEMLGSYAPVMVCPTALKQGRKEEEDDACCSCLWKMCSRLSNFLYGMMETFIGIAYKQVTPVKRSLLAIENIFQGLVGIAYIVIEGGSIFVAVLNVALPILQILLAFLLRKPLRRKAAPWFAKRLKLAIGNQDPITEEQIKEEVFEDVGIFTAVAPHLADCEGFTELWLRFSDHGIGEAGAVELAAALEQLQQLKKLTLDLDRNSIGDAGTVALCEAVRRLPRLEEVGMQVWGRSDNLGEEGCVAWQQLQQELRSRGLGYVNIRGDLW